MKQPNILFITADQHRADCLGYAGQYPIYTPHLDQLAADGMRFSHAFTTIPTCCPARQSLLTGRTAESIGALWNYDITLPVAALSPESDTWTRQLKDTGYQLAYIGKWHVNPDHNPTEYGFDSYYGVEHYEDYFQALAPKKNYVNGWKGEQDIVELQETRTHVFARKAIEKIREFQTNGQPWHIRLDFPEPHIPCRPAKKFFELYNPEDIPKWHNFDETFEQKPFMQRQQLKNWQVEDYDWEDWASIVRRSI